MFCFYKNGRSWFVLREHGGRNSPHSSCTVPIEWLVLCTCSHSSCPISSAKSFAYVTLVFLFSFLSFCLVSKEVRGKFWIQNSFFFLFLLLGSNIIIYSILLLLIFLLFLPRIQIGNVYFPMLILSALHIVWAPLSPPTSPSAQFSSLLVLIIYL